MEELFRCPQLKVDLSLLVDRTSSELGMTLYDNFLDLFHVDQVKSRKLFGEVVKQSIREMSRTFPVLLTKNITNGTRYKFTDNFDKYISGEITADQVELIPLGISRVGLYFYSSYYWKYEEPILFSTRGGSIAGKCYYFAAFPHKLEYAPDGEFTQDSYIYMMSERTDEIFIKYLAKNAGEKIRRMVGSVDLGGNINIAPNLDQTISEIKQEIEEYMINNGTIMDMWRK